ncbi:hypothetical protein [Sphaerisporangium rufum]|nr:hypothetical protein [Sphaerisporangium rufum]
MRGGMLLWGGAGVAVVALAGLGVYLARVGLDEADKLASVGGLFVGLVGLGVAVYALVTGPASGGGVRQRATATGRGRVRQAGRDVNERAAARPGLAADGGAGAESGTAADAAHRDVRQRATAGDGGQVDQAGRDIDQR